MKKINCLIVFCLLFALLSCVGSKQKILTSTYYKRDISIKVDGIEYIGTAVLPQKSQYEFLFESQDKIDLATFSNCHREISSERPSVGVIFKDKNKIKIKYIPSYPIEKGSCPLRFTALNLKGAHSWGFIDIVDDKLSPSLQAKLNCNGNKELSTLGASICQSRAALVQSVEFVTEVVVAGSCLLPQSKDEKLFTFNIQEKECTYNFMEKIPPYREHRLTTIGYEDIILRELP